MRINHFHSYHSSPLNCESCKSFTFIYFHFSLLNCDLWCNKMTSGIPFVVAIQKPPSTFNIGLHHPKMITIILFNSCQFLHYLVWNDLSASKHLTQIFYSKAWSNLFKSGNFKVVKTINDVIVSPFPPSLKK